MDLVSRVDIKAIPRPPAQRGRFAWGPQHFNGSCDRPAMTPLKHMSCLNPEKSNVRIHGFIERFEEADAILIWRK